MADDEIIENIDKLLDIASEGSIESVHSFLATTGLDINYAVDDDETVLMMAVVIDNIAGVKCLLAAGADADRRNKDGVTALMLAASYGLVECLEVLLRSGANKSLTDSEGKTVLMYAVLGRLQFELDENIKDCVKFLINAGVDVNAQNMEGKTALMLATKNSWGRRCIKDLISAGADANLLDKDGRTALMHAAANFDINRIDRDIDVYVRSTMCGIEDFIDPNVFTDEAVNKDTSIIPLIRASSDINKQDKDGHTALMIACATRHLWCVIRLILAGADMNMRDSAGRTALMYSTMRKSFGPAENYEDIRVTSFLVEEGADVNNQDNEGMSPLMFAASSGYLQIINKLITSGADLEQRDTNRRTALVHALEQIKQDVQNPQENHNPDANVYAMSALLGEGANSVISEEFRYLIDETAGGYARHNYHNYSVLQFLLSNGATYFRLEYCPLLDTDKFYLDKVAAYLIANCCVFDEDMRIMKKISLTESDNNIKTIQEAVSNPWPLVKLAFIAVSSAIGHRPGRELRVHLTNLPLPIQDCLLFQRQIARLPVHHWEDIPLCFNPVEYERLPQPYPLLYNWPFGRELVSCDCERCQGKGLNFQL